MSAITLKTFRPSIVCAKRRIGKKASRPSRNVEIRYSKDDRSDRALHGVGPALITTTLILVAAFMSYLMSDMVVLSSFGILLAGAVFTALIADLFLLPALIFKLRAFGPEQASS
ncbi:MAG: MMPL family transporter [Gammaproteobacteria bacterium]